jgi:hypothetical protein
MAGWASVGELGGALCFSTYALNKYVVSHPQYPEVMFLPREFATLLVTTYYMRLLGREPMGYEAAGWIQEVFDAISLPSNTKVFKVGVRIASSPEAYSKFVERMARRWGVKRLPDQNLRAAGEALAKGGDLLDVLLEHVFDTPAFRSAFGFAGAADNKDGDSPQPPAYES